MHGQANKMPAADAELSLNVAEQMLALVHKIRLAPSCEAHSRLT